MSDADSDKDEAFPIDYRDEFMWDRLWKHHNMPKLQCTHPGCNRLIVDEGFVCQCFHALCDHHYPWEDPNHSNCFICPNCERQITEKDLYEVSCSLNLRGDKFNLVGIPPADALASIDFCMKVWLSQICNKSNMEREAAEERIAAHQARLKKIRANTSKMRTEIERLMKFCRQKRIEARCIKAQEDTIKKQLEGLRPSSEAARDRVAEKRAELDTVNAGIRRTEAQLQLENDEYLRILGDFKKLCLRGKALGHRGIRELQHRAEQQQVRRQLPEAEAEFPARVRRI